MGDRGMEINEPHDSLRPGYYSLSFLDPDGIRLEVNHVPGKGVFEKGARFDPARDYPLTGRPEQTRHGREAGETSPTP